jgi:sterol desaturase/sphingolipid hydroxylase (fatty acid hydroxylase superfamily)
MTQAGISLLTSLYLGLFVGGLAFFWLWEDGAPLKPFADERARRGHAFVNLGVLAAVILFADLFVGTYLLRIGAHLLDAPAGLLTPLGLPVATQIVVAFLAVDLYEYGLHRLAHRWRPLWLLHAVHHSDPHVDMTTAARHHPLETAIALVPRVALYPVLGLPLWIEVVRIVIVNVLFLLQHANVSAPRAIEALRVVFVTPAVHRQHHSPDAPLIDRNFGQIFSFWDRAFGTYAEPEADLPAEYGLRKLRESRWQTLAGVLLTPLRARAVPGPL